MWTKGEEPPLQDVNESNEAPSMADLSLSSMQKPGKSDDNTTELTNYKEMMLKNQFDLKKKTEEVQEYAEKLTKIKSKVKLSRRSADSSTVGQLDPFLNKKKDSADNDDGDDDKNIYDEKIKAQRAKSYLLQKKLVENRRVFQQRNKELFEIKRAVEEKVEEIRQQINDTDLSIEKDKRFIALNDKINELQVTIIDLQDNLKEKDSVINSKTQAITLMSEDLSKKSKTTLDTLEETKIEMRMMQENFIQLELSFKNKIDHLINQLAEKDKNLDIIQNENEKLNMFNAEKDTKIIDMEKKIQELMNTIENKNIQSNFTDGNEKIIQQLKQELEESNKNMIKLKTQHKNKFRNLQKRLEDFRTMSDTNDALMKLENQVALLEEEKGNLQLSLVDFDELKASNEELHRRINDLESSTVTQSKEIEGNIEAISILENQKLDLIQELHGLRQELSALENENSELENLRVTAELKVVELEEQLEKLHIKNKIDSDNTKEVDNPVESEINHGMDKKSTDSTGSNESFERIMDASESGIAVLANDVTTYTDEISRLNERISHLTQENSELVIKYTKIHEKMAECENWHEQFQELTNEYEKIINGSITDQKFFENMQTESNEKISLLELQLSEGNSMIQSLENVIEEKNKLERDLRETIEKLGIEIKNSEERISNLTHEIDDFETTKTLMIEELDNLKRENGEYIRIIDEKNIAVNDLESKLIHVNKEHLENINLLEKKLTGINKELNERNDEMREKIISNEAELEYLRDELKRKNEILREMEIINDENEMNNSKLNDMIEILTKKIDIFNANMVEKDEIIAESLVEIKNLQTELKEETDKNIGNLSIIEEMEIKLQNEIRKNNESPTEEDMLKLNQQLELSIADLSNKIKENDELKTIIDEKEKIIDNNFTSEVKIALEERILLLERELENANNNTQAQLHKMKIIAANLKKKSGQCQTLETKLYEIEEKYMMEKQEKEEMNENIRALNKVQEEMNETIYTLNKNKEENEETMNNITLSLKNAELDIESEKAARDQLAGEFENYIEKSTKEMVEKNQELMNVKEKARELGVRMQVMEAEYLEQLNTIHKSETEHRILLSKLSEVNELLEITKNESAKQESTLESLRTQIDVIKKDNANEIMEKMGIINELMIERDESKIKLEELLLELEVYKEKNEKLMEKHEEWIEKHEVSTTTQNICNQEVKVSLPSSPVSSAADNRSVEACELSFNASKYFDVIPSEQTSDNGEISSLKKLLDEAKKEKIMIENKYEELSNELYNLKLQMKDSIEENEKNKMEMEHKEMLEEIKLDENDDEWGWNAKEAEISSNIDNLQPFSSIEIQLNAKIAELEDTIKDLKDKELNLNKEIKLIQTKNGKLIRKLKEYKIQNESLQQQLKIQMTSGELSDLDTAIEEELKCQVSKLEKNLQTITTDNEKIALERDNCLKRIEILVAANERFTDIKERQDRDLEIMYIRNDELNKKIQSLEEIVDDKTSNFVAEDKQCDKCKEKVLKIQESLELLIVENEELRKLIELEKAKLAQTVSEIDEKKLQSTEELKINFYDMLEKSHNIEKQCHSTLDEIKQEKINYEEHCRLNLTEANEKIRELEEDIVNKQTIIKNFEETIDHYRVNLNKKIEQLSDANNKIGELEIHMTNEIAIKERDIEFLDKIVQDLRSSSLELTNELIIAKQEIESNQIIFEKEISAKELQVQILENDLRINLNKMNKQEEELFEQQRQLKQMEINSEINLKKCQELEQKCLENLQDANKENLIVKHAHDLFVMESNEKIQKSDEELALNRDKMKTSDYNIKIMEENLKLTLNDGEKWRLAHGEIEKKLTEVNNNMTTLTELLNVRVQEVADLKQYIQKLEFDKLALESCKVNVDDLNKKLIHQGNEIISISNRYQLEIDEKSQEIINLQNKISILNLKYDENNLQLENQAQELKSLKESVNNSEKLIATLKTIISTKDGEILHMENQMRCHKDEIQQSAAIINELKIELREKVQEIDQLQVKLTELTSINQHEIDELNVVGNEMKSQLSAKNEEIEDLKYILNESTYPTIIQQLQGKIDKLYEEKSQLEQTLLSNLKNLSDRKTQNVQTDKESEMNRENASDLDLALYMWHQRDVRCEELTHELIQLLEERDTLQLRLSNAIRINEELRRLPIPPEYIKNFQQHDDSVDAAVVPTTNQVPAAIVDDLKPQIIKSSLPISQIAQSDEEKKLLAQKLSQLHNVGHRKDVRLLDERELRNTQQMSLIARKDVLSTLPSDAAARLINANHTHSQEVGGQSGILSKWLWGKSSPKVVHM